MPFGSVIVYTSSQEGSQEFDALWLKNFGVEVIRDRAKILLPTPRVTREVCAIVEIQGIKSVFFGAAAPLALMSHSLRNRGAEKIVALTHGHEVWWSKVWPFTWMMRRIGNGVDHLTFLGEFTRSNISRALSPRARDGMVKIAPGIDTDHFAPQAGASTLRTELKLDKKKVIVSVGRLVHRKGQDTLIEALPEVLSSIPDAHVLFIGEGPYKNYLVKRAQELNILQHVTFLGRIQYSDLPRAICVGDIFAMPSRSRLAGLEVEGLGIVYLEASSCGLPVIGGISGGAPDAVLEGETGFAVDGTSAPDVARAVIRLLSNPKLATRMGERGREWIISDWRWELWSARFNSLL